MSDDATPHDGRDEFVHLEESLRRLTDSELRSLALQTRSKEIRDYLVRSLTGDVHNFGQFITSIRGREPRAILHPKIAALLAQVIAAQRLFSQDIHDALCIYEQLLKHYGHSVFSSDDAIVYIDLLNRVGRGPEVDHAVNSLGISEFAPAEATALLSNASVSTAGAGSRPWLSRLNAVFAVDGLAPLELAPGEAPVFDRLESTSVSASVDGPLVTVIVPTWNPGPWLWTAVRSLTQQTYANLQILVMDDHSDLRFKVQLERLLDMDSRIQVVASPENRGTYASRNVAVRDYAHGDFVTIQDDDDWSHPQRVERQVQFSQSRGLSVGIARAARVTEDLRFVRRAATFVRRGYPTTLISRATFSEVGFWDPVRRNSDFEFIRRVRNSKKAVGDLGQAPLMLQRHREGSLSSSEVWEGFSDQARRWQNWLAEEWHKRSTFAGKRIYMGSGLGLQRPYPAPLALMKGGHSDTSTAVDSLIINDWGLNSPSEPAALDLAHSLLTEGKTIGLIHIDGIRPLANSVSSETAALARKNGVSVLSWSDETVAEVAHIMQPSNLMLCDTVQSRVWARQIIVHGDQRSVPKIALRLLHLQDSHPFELQ